MYTYLVVIVMIMKMMVLLKYNSAAIDIFNPSNVIIEEDMYYYYRMWSCVSVNKYIVLLSTVLYWTCFIVQFMCPETNMISSSHGSTTI